MRGNKKSHIQNFTMRLSNQSLIFANYRPKSTICQHLYTLCVEGKFTRNGEDCGGVSDCEELVGVTWRGV